VTLTRSEVLAAEEEIGASLDVMEVTIFGDAEPKFIVATPTCGYCGTFRPGGRCVKCGASEARYPASKP
jgi:hypothetical protein